jgi:hypothetical protein
LGFDVFFIVTVYRIVVRHDAVKLSAAKLLKRKNT